MPTLNWIGKEAVVNHDKEVPFRLLRKVKSASVGDNSQNLIIHGDNLEALKALMPYYLGKIKFVFIDPPYNTGNEGWVYNDKVNSPKIKTWLGKVVGNESEDLCHHDKWLCMMFPRLKLLKELMRDDGVIFIAIDDNESCLLKLMLDEIFGANQFIQQIIWKNKYGPGAMTKGFGNVHEYVFCYSKTPILSIEAELSPEDEKKYTGRDSKFDIRGGYITQPLATRSKDHRPNLIYPIKYKGEEIWPDKQWIWARERMEQAIADDEVVFRKTKDKWSVRFKQYLRDENGLSRLSKPISIFNGPFNQDGTWELEDLFQKKIFQNPKPKDLIKKLISMTVNGNQDKDFFVLDSFAGSGTTGHAVLDLNKQDGGNRKFILIEMEDGVAKDITAERIKRAIKKYDYNDGFEYCELSKPLFNEAGHIEEECDFNQFATYIYFTETQTNIDPKAIDGNYIGEKTDTEYYLIYKEKGKNVLNKSFLKKVRKNDAKKIVYADFCELDEKILEDAGIVFKQIPYEVKVY